MSAVCTYLRISLTDRCDFDCFYCMPSGRSRFLPPDALLTRQEILFLSETFCRHGIRHIRLTGGEPLLRRDVGPLLKGLQAGPAPERLSLTTNGWKLGACVADLARQGLTHVNVSLDTLRPRRFAKVTGRNVLSCVKAGVREAAQCLPGRVKINVLLIRGFNDDEIVDFASWGLRHGLTVRFIEYFPTSRRSHIFHGHFVPSAVVRRTLEGRFGPLADEGPDPLAGPARYARLRGTASRIGFISSVTGSLCGTCNRLRLSADGKLYPCLHSDYHLDLAGPLRAGHAEALDGLIAEAARRKKDLNAFVCSRDFDMSSVGG